MAARPERSLRLGLLLRKQQGQGRCHTAAPAELAVGTMGEGGVSSLAVVPLGLSSSIAGLPPAGADA